MTDRYPGVLDNQQWMVKDKANAYATGSKTVKIAVGYFYVSGFDLLKKSLEDADKVQLVIGRQTDAQTKEELVKGFTEDLNKVEKNEDSEKNIRHLYHLIQEDKVDVRIYTKERFHPKMYLFKYGDESNAPNRAIVGSSNFSPSGLTGGIELNIEENDQLATNFLDDWFDGIWGEAEEFREGLIKVVEGSKFGDVAQEPIGPSIEGLISPFEATKMYIRSHFEREIDEATLFEDIEGEYQDKLAEFQNDAVRAARYTLDRYNGVILSDSVGLGKTWIGSALVEDYSTPQSKLLIIAPKRLHKMWKETLNKEFNVQGRSSIISFHELSLMDAKKIEKARTYDLILIDEAHKLRNQGSKRYSNIQNIGRKDKKYILLTATPVQNSVTDLHSIINIFADDEDFDINLYNNEDISDIFKEYQKESLKDDSDENKIERLKKDIDRVMREVVISRTREYITDNYENITIGGRKIKTPGRKPQIVPPESKDMKILYSEIIDIVAGKESEEDGGLNLPYVGVRRYGDVDSDKFELQYRNFGSLLTILLFKRLESSLAAFRESITRLKRREIAIRKIAASEVNSSQDREEIVGYFEELNREEELEDIDIDDVMESVEEMGSDEREQILTDVKEDLNDLDELKEKAEEYIREDGTDEKIQQLKDILRGELQDEKVLLFSQYIPTVEYIFEGLTGENNKNISEFEGRRVGFVHGDTSEEKMDTIINQFAPKSQNVKTGFYDEEIDILISTDVLSAGQNLQDSRVVVNYDLHWNPMKMEQRIGRVDRITTQHDELLIYNFTPTTELEDTLGLLEKIRRKIQGIKETFGKDSPILDNTEDRVEKNLIIYDKVKEDGSEFSEEDFKKTKSKYDKFKLKVKQFCEENNVRLQELQRIAALEDKTRISSKYNINEEAYMVLAKLRFSDGSEDIKSIVVRNVPDVERFDIDGQTAITDLPIDEDDESKIFEYVKSNKVEYNPNIRDCREIKEILESESKWNNQVLNIDNKIPESLNNLYNYCSEIEDDSSYSKETREKAREILRKLENHRLTDFYIRKLKNIYRYRRNYGKELVVLKIWKKLQEFALISPRKVEDVEIRLVERIVNQN